MSKEEKNNKENKEEKGKDEKPETIDVNMALVLAQLEEALDTVEKLETERDELKEENYKLRERINQDSKKTVINDIAQKTTLSKKILAEMDLKELLKYKKILDTAKTSSFKSATPLKLGKDDPRAKVESMHDDYMRKLKGGHK